ncbi:MAG TPA: hypothetical protein VH598_11530, partial [Verrucomicrobiae bacterium]|nr:hypothetical protein [Verrucomicrobiae bacterium]
IRQGIEHDLLKSGIFRSVTTTEQKLTVDFTAETSDRDCRDVALKLGRLFSVVNPDGWVTVCILVKGQKRYELDYSQADGVKAERNF